MYKSTSLILSSLALATGIAALTISLVVPGPMGSPGSSGNNGNTGPIGPSGEDGQTPYIGENGNWWIDDEDTGISATATGQAQEFFPQVNVGLTPLEEDLIEETWVDELTTLSLQQAYANNLIINEGYIGISTPAELMAISNAAGKYVLLNSIDFTNVVAPAWSPINFFDGLTKVPFSGVLDGAGFSIDALLYTTIDNDQYYDYYGMFDELDGAAIRNLNIAGFNFYKDNANYMGLLAGRAIHSTFENINLTNNRLSATGDYIGGIAGFLYNSSVSQIDINLLIISGHFYLGGIAGESILSVFSNIITNDVSIDGRYGNHGGISGYSFQSVYVKILSELSILLGGNSLATQRGGIGGLIGNSNGDRLVMIETQGLMEFTTLDTENYSIERVGGTVGFASNTVFLQVVNKIDIVILFQFPIQVLSIVSIGGIVGATEFAALYQVLNEGNVRLVYDRNDLDESVYLFSDDHPIEYLGGIIGYSYASSYLYQVVNTGEIEGVVDVGGIIGSTGIPLWYFQQFIYMDEVASLGTVNGILNVGGIMGLNDVRTNLIARNLMNYNQVYGEQRVGGLFGVLAPTMSVKVTIKNAYNYGDVIVKNYDGGGLIGATWPVEFDFNLPLLGEVHLYHSFNMGEIIALEVGRNGGGSYNDIGIGAIVGNRIILTLMYGVSYLLQVSEIEMYAYDGDTNTYIASGDFIDVTLPGVGVGNQVDVAFNLYREDYTDPNSFLYANVWDFQNVWMFVDNNGIETIPALRFISNLNA